MKNLISISQGFLVPSKDNPSLLYGDVAFIYHKGNRLFSMTLDGKIIPPNSGVEVIPVYLHKNSESLKDYCWYAAKGKIIISKLPTSAFFLPKEIIAEIPPEEFFVKGAFTIPSDSCSTALFKLKENQIVPLNEKGGLVVFKYFRYEGKFERGHSYDAEGTVLIPYGHNAGIFIISKIKNI
jgi:hypothetical protein